MGKIGENLVIHNYKRLIVVGIAGTLEKSLHESGNLLKQRFPGTEVAPILKEPSRDFLAAIMFNPLLDITLDRYPNHVSAIVGYSLDKERLIKVISEISGVIGFYPHTVQKPEFSEDRKFELEFEKNTYENCEKLALMLQRPLGEVWGMVRYAHFLGYYIGLPEEQARDNATKRFGIMMS